MLQDSPGPQMHTAEDTREQGIPGQDTTDASWASSVPGVQADWGDTVGTTEAHPEPVDLAGTPSHANLFDSPVQETLSGFAPATWNPKPYQLRGLEWLVTRPEGALFLPPGMGKTSISLAAILKLKEMGFRARTLILAPLTVCLTTWQSEPIKWGQFYQLKIGLAHGPDKDVVLNDPYYDIVVMNYDGLAWATPVLMKGHGFDVLLCDELTRLKNTGSQRFKIIKKLLPTFKFRWGLTGTPAANGLIDLFGQLYVLDLGARLGRFITHFRMKYLHQKPWDRYRYYITQEKADELIGGISDICMYLDPKDHLTLPGLIDIPLDVTLPSTVMGQYKALELDFITRLQENTVTAANAGVLTSKLRQFTGGAIYTGEEREWVGIHDAKIERLKQLVEELAGEPLLVAYQFHHELERLLTTFPDALAIRGGLPKHKLQEIVEKWNTGNIPILFVQPTAAALGLNLQFGGAAICWFSMTYNLEEFIQLIARLNRQGQAKLVRNYMLLAEKTIDPVIAQIMVTKDATQNSLFEGLKALRP